MLQNPVHISFVGAGNIAWHLAPALHKKGYIIDTIYNRSVENAEVLAAKVLAKAASLDTLSQVSADILILAIADKGIDTVVKHLLPSNMLLVHTAGSVPMQTLSAAGHQRIGVLYPLQSFSKTKELDLSKVPFFIEAAHQEDFALLQEVAHSWSDKVIAANSEERQQLHIAAVFACNFTNAMYGIAAQLMEEKKMDFSLLMPLIKETYQKIENLHPLAAQTGPASRGDTLTIEKHLSHLSQNPKQQSVYKLLSQYIENQIIKNNELQIQTT